MTDIYGDVAWEQIEDDQGNKTFKVTLTQQECDILGEAASFYYHNYLGFLRAYGVQDVANDQRLKFFKGLIDNLYPLVVIQGALLDDVPDPDEAKPRHAV